jgi:hypothetical protein
MISLFYAVCEPGWSGLIHELILLGIWGNLQRDPEMEKLFSLRK